MSHVTILLNPLTILVLLFAVVSCDTDRFLASDPDKLPAGIQILRQIPDTSTFIGEGLDLFLAQYFRHTADDTLSFEVNSRSSAVAAKITDGFPAELILKGLEAGSAIIDITAKDSDGNSVLQNFTISVHDPCPRGPHGFEAEYFLLAAGQSWRYKIETWQVPHGYSPNGSLIWTVQTESCAAGNRYLEVEEVFEPVVGTPSVRYIFFVVTDDRIVNETYLPEGIPRFFPSTWGTVSFSTRSRPYPTGTDLLTRYELVSGKGIVSRLYFMNWGVMNKHRQTWELLDD